MHGRTVCDAHRALQVNGPHQLPPAKSLSDITLFSDAKEIFWCKPGLEQRSRTARRRSANASATTRDAKRLGAGHERPLGLSMPFSIRRRWSVSAGLARAALLAQQTAFRHRTTMEVRTIADIVPRASPTNAITAPSCWAARRRDGPVDGI
jgi:hypothetical protein